MTDGTFPLHRTLYASEEHRLNIDPEIASVKRNREHVAKSAVQTFRCLRAKIAFSERFTRTGFLMISMHKRELVIHIED
jgi:hypothetical protein